MNQRLGGRFILGRKLGSGGMSTVFLGTDEALDRPVAIKVLRSEFMESDIGIRFRREGRTAGRLSHPNIVQVYDAGEDDLDGETVSYIVMEHVSGGDLRDLIYERGTLSRKEISNLEGAAAGLAHAHDRGVVHRDIKPPNILLDENGKPKLADFGIARALDATQATRTGTYMGTARYSSPEQLQGKEITPKSDIYSLGVTLYEAVTGSPLFSGTPIEVATQHISRPPNPPGELVPVDADLEALILACLAKDPADRPTATQVRDQLADARLQNGSAPAYSASSATESTAVQEAVPAGRRTSGQQTNPRRAPLLVALVAILVLLGGVSAFALLGYNDEQAQSTPATTQEPSTGSAAGGQAQEGPTTVETTTAPVPQSTTPESVSAVAKGGTQPGGNSGEQAAAQTVREVYELAENGSYAQSYDLLSPAFRQERAQTQAKWAGTFAPLKSIRFVEGPDAQVTGNAAQVTGVTIAVRTDRTERNTVTWTLIRDDGQWKLNNLQIDTDVIST